MSEKLFCSNCGKSLNESEKFCSSCGNSVNASNNNIANATVSEKESGAGKVLGIINIFSWIFPVIGLPCSIAGIIVGLKKTKKLWLYISIGSFILSLLGLIMM